MNQEKIGKFIAKCRKEKKITQKEFAEKIGVTDKTVSRWENGHYMPDISLFNIICEVLEISVVELLAGDIKTNKNEEVDKTVSKLVDISNNKIHKNRVKSFTISFVIILIIIVLASVGVYLITREEERGYRNKPGDDIHVTSRMAIKEKEDGWVCYFYIEYERDHEYPYSYHYECENFKYKHLDGYYMVGTEKDENGEYEYQIEINHPRYLYNKKYKNDLKTIREYFEEKRFNTEITLADLQDLELENIDKNEVLELYNHVINSNLTDKYGSYPNNNYVSHINLSLIKDNYQWQVGYMLEMGHIKYINVELLIGGEYLSDLIANKTATEEQKQIYNRILYIENYILEQQKFEIPKELVNEKPFMWLDENFDEINRFEEE